MQTINNLGGFIIDMDGVLWHGNKPLPGLIEFFSTLRELKIPFVLATNNASLTQQQYLTKLANMGVEVCAEEILTSSMATACYLKENLPTSKRRVFVIGESGLTEPLQQQGFEITSTYYPADPQATTENIWADIVVSGLDRKLDWNKLATATLNLRAGAEFYATNADTTLPTELGEVMGNGGVLAALTAVTGVKPIVIGKPEPILYQQAFEILGTDKHNTIAIGDRLNTDILGAVNAGMRSIMVLTGVSSEADLADIDYRPDWIFQDIQEITRLLKQ
ncbi:HAD-IIA family hydrolase [Methylophaga pinxianii]|uniref:HAD-IIA family hydrolase n=1 Tax=Methylophaga pinxianii TaxID=2881052 RepID=UPI001CF281AC|nr:HAD-IIA family hydrolase [Methylophaga pinxianii]MCB2426283.1 HAD-IIA family hydrolase [Methylophaga pinxianii]UPH46319.1 HAD-IIA family hydrolase [Methylophaga pinxianii]